MRPTSMRAPARDGPGDYGRLVRATVRERLAAAGDPERGAGARAYLKSDLPCHGVRADELRRIVRAVASELPPPDREAWLAAVCALWDGATHREERHAALALAGVRAARAWQDPELLPLYRGLIVTGAWWDLVDEVATHRVGPLLRAWPDQVTPVVRSWTSDPDLWLRRAAVICQVGSRDAVDLDLLELAVRANVDDTTFWLRKAIGWALRDAGRSRPDWVLGLVADLDGQLSGLSRREALKHLT